MVKPASRAKPAWPRKANCGRISVPVYRRLTPSGNFAYMVANYAKGKRRFDSFPTEDEAMEAANRLARRLSEGDVVAASMTREQAIEYASATQTLAPFKLSLNAVAASVAECLKTVGNLSVLSEAVRFYVARHKQTTRKPVA